MTKVKMHPWAYGEELSESEFHEVRYATRMWLLQERVPLTFIQARIYLHDEKPESLEDIAVRFGIPIEEVVNAEPYIREKVSKAMESRDIFFGHEPISNQIL